MVVPNLGKLEIRILLRVSAGIKDIYPIDVSLTTRSSSKRAVSTGVCHVVGRSFSLTLPISWYSRCWVCLNITGGTWAKAGCESLNNVNKRRFNLVLTRREIRVFMSKTKPLLQYRKLQKSVQILVGDSWSSRTSTAYGIGASLHKTQSVTSIPDIPSSC